MDHFVTSILEDTADFTLLVRNMDIRVLNDTEQ